MLLYRLGFAADTAKGGQQMWLNEGSQRKGNPIATSRLRQLLTHEGVLVALAEHVPKRIAPRTVSVTSARGQPDVAQGTRRARGCDPHRWRQVGVEGPVEA